MRDTGLNISLSLMWLSKDNSTHYPDFKAGRFKFDIDQKTLTSLKLSIVMLDKLQSFGMKTNKLVKSTNFHRAVKRFFNSDIVDVNEFFRKLNDMHTKVVLCVTVKEYVSSFVNIYNHCKHKNKITIISSGDNNFELR